MKNTLIPILLLLLIALPCQAQSLADVLCSIQERKRAVEQSGQVADHLPSVSGTPVTIRQQALIEWAGLGSHAFPTDQQVNSLSIDAKVALLNQAIKEFRELQGLYVNLRKEDLEGMERIGVIRPYLPEDFADLGRADASNFHALLFALARDVRRLAVLPWPIGGKQRTKNYWISKWEEEVPDGDGEYSIEVKYAPGSVHVSGWMPATLAGGTANAASDSWQFPHVVSGGAWGNSLQESVIFSALSDTHHYEDPEDGDFDLRDLLVDKTTRFHTEAALFSKIPGLSDQIGGRVAVVIRNEWTPVNMGKVSVTAPNSWDPGDAGFEVALTQVDPASTYSFGADPDISVDLDWVALGQSTESWTGNDGIPYGYDATKAWLEGLAESWNPDWLIAWEQQQGIGPDGIAGKKTTLFRRQLHGLCAPAFEKGLDATGKAAHLDLAEKFSAPPAGDGRPVLHPVPGVLLGIPVGVGLDGSVTGYVGISPCEREVVGDRGILYPHTSPHRLTTRFDYAANLRFIGPAQDFHVVYATSRSESARGQNLPGNGPTNAQRQETGNVEFFDAWDTPRLRQVISRDLFIDITPLGHFKNEIRIYRRPESADTVDRKPGKLATPPGTSHLIRTIIIENPDAVSSPYINQPEKVRATDGTTVYEVWRSGFPVDGQGSDPSISFKLTDNGTVRLFKGITFPAVGQAAITTQIDGHTASVETIQDGTWWWHDGAVPANVSILSGGQTTVVENVFSGSSPGSQGGRYPNSSTTTIPDEPNLSFTWHDSGRLSEMSRGPWSASWSLESGDLKAETKLNQLLLDTTWTTWSNGAGTVRTTVTPDGATTLKSDDANDWSEIKYGDATSTGLPGLPHKLTRRDGSGATWDWTETSGGGTKVEVDEGLFSGDSVVRGTRSTIETNARGYSISTSAYIIQGGSTLQTAGSSTQGGQFTTWGAPTKTIDFTTGLESLIGFDGQRERPSSTTDFLGNVTTISSYDALDRPTGFSWRGHSGSASYNSGGFGASSTLNLPGRTVSRSVSFDARGRATGGSVTAGTTSGFSLAHAANTKTLTTSNSLTGAASSSIINTADGSLQGASGDTLAFGGVAGANFIADNGLLKSTTNLQGLTARHQSTWTDAWGRVREIETSSSAGGSESTTFHYSLPASTTKRIEIRHASGRRIIEESQPWASGGIITRMGIDLNQNGLLDGGDRYITTVTEIVGSVLRTTVTQTGNTTALMVRDHNPSTGVTITTFNGGEDVVTETPDFTAKTVQTTHKRGGITIATKSTTLNHLGQADLTTISGTGIPAATHNPVFRADGSLASVSLNIGGAVTSASFKDDGTVDTFTHPLLGPLAVSHGFSNGNESLAIHGTTATRSLDGTASSLGGAGVMDQSRQTTIAGGNFAETIEPGTGASTTQIFNPAGAKTLHQYAAGANPATTWLPGGLLESVSRGRGGVITYEYSDDGARDLLTITWPTVESAGFPGEPFYGAAIGLTERDDAGNITEQSDPSGTRQQNYEKNRLTSSDWLGGELSAYKVVRQHDGQGRLETVAVHRNGAAIHTITPAYTGLSSEISGMSTDGFSATVTRDAAGRYVTGFTRASVTQRWERGTAGRITAANTAGTVSGAPWFNYTGFDNRGRRQTVATNKGTWTYGYRGGESGDGQLVSATSTGGQLGNFSYNVDGIGRRDFGNNQQDALNRFLAIEHPQEPTNLYISADPEARLWINGVEAQPFDGVWTHPVAHPGATGGWEPWHVKGVLEGAGDPGAHPDAVAEFSGHVYFPPTAESLTFDADGNRESSSLWDFGWDGRNKLVRARTKTWSTAPEGWDLTFDYDAEGRRFKKTVTRYAEGMPVEHKVVYFVWDGWDLLYERHQDVNGNPLLERRYVWGPDIADGAAGGAGGLLLIRETRGQTTSDYYPIYDGTGHVIGLADDGGNLVAEYWWGPFGELIHASGEMADANPWRYATKYFDTETGLYYFGHRYYDPVTGQWLSREPLGESESINLYSYCHNDPINNVDVLGLKEASVHYEEYQAAKIMLREARRHQAMNRHVASLMEPPVWDHRIGYGLVHTPEGTRRITANEHEIFVAITASRMFGETVMPSRTTQSLALYAEAKLWSSGFALHRFERQAAFLDESIGNRPGTINPLLDDSYFDDENPEFLASERRAFLLSLNPARKVGLHAARGEWGDAAISYATEVAIWSGLGVAGEFLGSGRVAFSTGLRSGGIPGAARIPASFFGNTRLEVQALQRQGLSRSEAFQQIRSFNAGNADGYAFHFTNPKGAAGILGDGAVNSGFGIAGRGVYAGTTPTPSALLKYSPTPGWALTPTKPVRIPLRISPELNPVRPVIPFRTQVFRVDQVPLKP